MDSLFIKEPVIEWYHDTPFAIGQLNIKYSHLLANLALKYEPDILKLDYDKRWHKNIHTTSSRYNNYNTFLLDSAYMPLFLALKKTFRFLLAELNQEIYPSYIRSWYNVNRIGQNIDRPLTCSKIYRFFFGF